MKTALVLLLNFAIVLLIPVCVNAHGIEIPVETAEEGQTSVEFEINMPRQPIPSQTIATKQNITTDDMVMPLIALFMLISLVMLGLNRQRMNKKNSAPTKAEKAKAIGIPRN